MLHKTLIFRYVSTVGTNPNGINFKNWVLCVAVNTYHVYWRTKNQSNTPDGTQKTLQLLLVTPVRCNRTHNSLLEANKWFIEPSSCFYVWNNIIENTFIETLRFYLFDNRIIKHWLDLFNLNFKNLSQFFQGF